MQFVGVGNLKIPVDRVPVLVGKNGSIKRRIEKLGEVKLEIDSGTGEVSVVQKGDALLASVTMEVVQAIGRGFSPEKAEYLYNESFQLIVISLRDFARAGSKRIGQVRGRVIGRDGRTRKIIEELTSTHVSVYGDTVSVIGDYLSIYYSKEAIMKLINGSKHKTVYKYLENLAKEIRFKRIEESFG